jgi:hypothetical protein
MGQFLTIHHSLYSQCAQPALWLGVTLAFSVGCQGKIESPEASPFRDTASDIARRALGAEESAAASGNETRTSADTSMPTKKPQQAADEVETAARAYSQRYQCKRPELRGTAQLGARRLTRDEYLLSAQIILGKDILERAEVQKAAAQIPAETTGDITREFQNVHAYDHVAGVLMTAEALAKAVVGDPAARERIFGSCGDAADEACAARYLDGDARRILKRPIGAERRTSLLADFEEIGAGAAGLELLLERLLQAPEAVFHLEFPLRQDCEAEDSRVTAACDSVAIVEGTQPVDDWTVAARVSYALTGHGPDDKLLDAAARGELRAAKQVRSHAMRLMQTAEARKQLDAILDAWLDLRSLPTPTQAVADSIGVDPSGLNEEARRELLDFAAYQILDLGAGASALMTADVGFPRSERMAALYGVRELAKPGEPVTLTDGHRGLLLRVAPLLSGSLRTSPIMRGVYVRKRLLCDELASPDFSVVEARMEALHEAEPKPMSSRQITEKITGAVECMACHTQINPLGFPLERYDAIGARREVEIDFAQDGTEIGTHPIDTQVVGANIEVGGPDQLSDAEDLVQTIAESTKYGACISERLYAHAQLRTPTPADDCALAEIEAAVHKGVPVRDAWLLAVVNADTFVRKAPEAAP